MNNIPRELLSIESISVAYGAIEVLRNIDLTLHHGEIVTLIGANGAGKSTLLGSILGQPKPRAGKIYYQGKSLSNYETHQISRFGIALCPEGRRLFPQMTVLENLMMGTLCHNHSGISKEQLEFVYHLFPLLKNRHAQKASTLSGGEQQMVAIGRSLMAKPTLLLLDEPSLGLAPQLVQFIFNTLKTIAGQGTTLFLVEQNAYQALQLANRGYVLAHGQIVLADQSARLLNNPLVKQAYLGDFACKDYKS